MLKRFTVGQKIFCSFSIIFILFGIVSVESLIALHKSSSGFTDYRYFANDSNLIGKIQAGILQSRTYVKDFIITGDNKYSRQYNETAHSIFPLLATAAAEINSTDRNKIIHEIDSLLNEYDASFSKVASVQKERDRILDTVILPAGSLMEQNFEHIIDNLKKVKNNSQALYYCAKGVRHLILARLFNTKYLDSSLDLHRDKAIKEMEMVNENLSTLATLLKNGNLDLLKDIGNAAKEYTNSFKEVITLTETRDKLINNELDVIGPQMSDLIDKAKLSVIADQSILGPTLQARNDRAIMSTYIFGIIAFLLGTAAVFIVGRDITLPLRKVVAAAYRIAEGDMTQEIKGTDRKDELGSLARAFNKMNDSLIEMAGAMERVANSDLTVEVEARSENDTIGKALTVMLENLKGDNLKIHEAVRTLSSSLSQISAASAELTASAAETASAVAETNATVEEVKQTAHLSNEKSRQVADVARKAVSTSQQGRKAADEASSGMKEIRMQMDTIAQSIVKLSEQSQHIGDIIYVVNDLADQSNILAVNASIEASKAGIEGRGFTVVAREIRNLSDQSKQSVAQIQSILADIQKATSSAVMITEQGGKAVETGANLSAQTGEAILNLSTVINQSAQSSAQIAASSQEQLAGLDQVAVALGSIKQAGEQNLESSRQLEEAVKDLDQQARSLKDMMDRFKL
ncbi:methyl-accepting chemotaxis protein [Maridesulfovibrio sp.]|uniref:HAMP domain-containing methyl-accepting chemotaxis protein n=1 Tax=Maridesulfovibrio sp. TaxID=2795000 RepID=UPI0029F53B74|nr:methyl-accepting chemotaxis protein [Maridesulfovibrio sp.]